MGSGASRQPSWSWGVAQAVRLWRLVVALWVVSVAAFLPAVWVVGGTAAPRLERLPAGDECVPAGDELLILLPALEEVAAPLTLAVASAIVALWAWTVLWHAGVVNWQLWAAGRRVRVGEVLGLGVVSWWRYARLSAAAATALVALLAALWAPLSWAVELSHRTMAERRVVGLLILGTGAAILLALVVWAATLRAAWLLGLPERRSVVLAWLQGLAGTVRRPVASLGVLLLWVVPAAALALAPLAAGWWFESLRDGWALPLLGQAAAAGRAFCWVALYCSFAPVTGLAGPAIERE